MKTLIFLFLYTLSSLIMGAEPIIGEVALVEGTVYLISKDNKKEQLEETQPLYQGDQILTMEDGYVKILMKDDTVFDIGESSQFIFSKFDFKSKSERKAEYNFIYGQMRSIFSVKAKNEEDLKIKTPDVVMGVRGTEIFADVTEKDGTIQTDITLTSGRLRINHLTENTSYAMKTGDLFTSRPLKGQKHLSKLDKKDLVALRKNPPGKRIKKFLRNLKTKRKLKLPPKLKKLNESIKAKDKVSLSREINRGGNLKKGAVKRAKRNALKKMKRNARQRMIRRNQRPPCRAVTRCTNKKTITINNNSYTKCIEWKTVYRPRGCRR